MITLRGGWSRLRPLAAADSPSFQKRGHKIALISVYIVAILYYRCILCWLYRITPSPDRRVAMADQLAACLAATLDPNADTRRAAEAALEAGGAQPGFAVALATVALAPAADVGVRQLAAVVLKKCIKEHWTPEGPKFRDPEIGEEEKARVRALLPAGLADPSSKINTAVAMAVAEVARWDCPQAWPELLPGLVAAITDQGDAHLVSGAVRCFGMFVDELSEAQVMGVAPVVLPELLRIAGDPARAPDLRRRALAIFKSVVDVADVLGRTRQADARAFMAATLPPWVAAAAAVLAEPTTAAGAELWGVKQEALACLVRLVPVFGKLVAAHLGPAMSAAWAMLVACLPLYEAIVVGGDPEGDLPPGVDPDDLESLVAELFEFVLTLVGSPRFLPALRPSLPEVAYLALGFMRMGAAQEERWAADPNAYVGDEDGEFWTVRASGEMLLDEVMEAGGDAGAAAVAGAVRRRAAEAAAGRAAGAPGWWRAREAVLLGLGAVADRLIDAQEMGAPLPPELDPGAVAAAVVAEDLSGGAPPFVAGRALWLVSRLADALPRELRPELLAAAAAALAPGNPPAVQVGGCQALARLCRARGAAPDVAAVADAALGGLCALLGAASEDCLHLVLEALAAVAAADPAGAARWEPHIAPGALRAWVDNVNDPLVGEDAAEVLRALARAPGCLPALQGRMLPTLCEAVASPAAHPPLLLAGCLDMLVMLLAPSQPGAAAAVSAAATGPVLHLLGSTDDEEVAAAGAAYLRTLLQVGGAGALGWGGAEPGAALQALLAAAAHLLRPGASDRACRNVGGLLLELLRHAGPQVVSAARRSLFPSCISPAGAAAAAATAAAAAAAAVRPHLPRPGLRPSLSPPPRRPRTSPPCCACWATAWPPPRTPPPCSRWSRCWPTWRAPMRRSWSTAWRARARWSRRCSGGRSGRWRCARRTTSAPPPRRWAACSPARTPPWTAPRCAASAPTRAAPSARARAGRSAPSSGRRCRRASSWSCCWRTPSSRPPRRRRRRRRATRRATGRMRTRRRRAAAAAAGASSSQWAPTPRPSPRASSHVRRCSCFWFSFSPPSSRASPCARASPCSFLHARARNRLAASVQG
jgi:hypothetical protein